MLFKFRDVFVQMKSCINNTLRNIQGILKSRGSQTMEPMLPVVFGLPLVEFSD